MSTSKASTYLDSNDGADLAPARTRLLFSAWIHHGPGFPGKVEYRVGPSKCGQFDVPWMKAVGGPENPVRGAAWIPIQCMQGKPLHLHLVQSLFIAQQNREAVDAQSFSEIAGATKALLSSADLRNVTDKIFGKACFQR